MSAHEPAGPADRRDGRSPDGRQHECQPTMGELLASCAAANAVSTPPERQPAHDPAESSCAEGEGERDAA